MAKENQRESTSARQVVEPRKQQALEEHVDEGPEHGVGQQNKQTECEQDQNDRSEPPFLVVNQKVSKLDQNTGRTSL